MSNYTDLKIFAQNYMQGQQNYRSQTQNSLPRQGNPDEYAQIYAQQNNLSFEEAKSQLKSQYGDPQTNSIFDNQFSEQDATASDNFDLSEYDELFGSENTNNDIKGLFQSVLDFFKGGNGPRNEGDPQHHINPETNSISGPQKEGDYNPQTSSLSQSNANSQAPDDYAQAYANEHNISLEEAKAELERMYGAPQQD